VVRVLYVLFICVLCILRTQISQSKCNATLHTPGYLTFWTGLEMLLDGYITSETLLSQTLLTVSGLITLVATGTLIGR
jgi:hypothetical protein